MFVNVKCICKILLPILNKSILKNEDHHSINHLLDKLWAPPFFNSISLSLEPNSHHWHLTFPRTKFYIIGISVSLEPNSTSFEVLWIKKPKWATSLICISPPFLHRDRHLRLKMTLSTGSRRGWWHLSYGHPTGVLWWRSSGFEARVKVHKEPESPWNGHETDSDEVMPVGVFSLRKEEIKTKENSADEDAGEEEPKNKLHPDISFPFLSHQLTIIDLFLCRCVFCLHGSEKQWRLVGLARDDDDSFSGQSGGWLGRNKSSPLWKACRLYEIMKIKYGPNLVLQFTWICNFSVNTLFVLDFIPWLNHI